jgi:choline-sulfatase
VAPRVHEGLQYHLDVAATVLGLAGLRVPRSWDGAPIDLDRPAGRDHLVVSQGAWSCQRGVRFGDHLYLRTWHDGYHGHWADEMLFDVVQDPHETFDRSSADAAASRAGALLLEEWTTEQLARTGGGDPMEVVRKEGGPFHVRSQLGPYVGRLRTTGRDDWARVLTERHPDEM